MGEVAIVGGVWRASLIHRVLVLPYRPEAEKKKWRLETPIEGGKRGGMRKTNSQDEKKTEALLGGISIINKNRPSHACTVEGLLGAPFFPSLILSSYAHL